MLTWNLQRRSRHKLEVMAFLRRELHPDIALLQEAFSVPTEAGETALMGRFSQQARLAIYSRGIELRYHPDDQRMSEAARSRVLVGLATLPHLQLLLVNIHQPTGQWRRPAGEEFFYVIPELERVFEMAVSIAGSTPMILGGDLNAAALFDSIYPPRRPEYSHAGFFARWNCGRLFNARMPFYEGEVRTLRTSKQPYQDDHIFVSSELANRLLGWKVMTEFPDEWTDHCPVVCDLDL